MRKGETAEEVKGKKSGADNYVLRFDGLPPITYALDIVEETDGEWTRYQSKYLHNNITYSRYIT